MFERFHLDTGTCYSLFPSSPGPFLGLVSEALSVRSEQRGRGPCVVHCLSGVGRSGLFLLAVAAVCHVHTVRTLPDLVVLAAHIAAWRKNPLRDREHFKFAYQLLLYYGQDLLMKREYFQRLHKCKGKVYLCILPVVQFRGLKLNFLLFLN